jgi:septum formation protein
VDAEPPASAPLILASASPRRRELLARTGVPFAVIPAEVDETPPPGVLPADLALLLARRKATEVATRHVGVIALGVDTVVDLDGMSLGKPQDEEDAVAMLRLLQGRRHAVHTGMAVVRRGSGHEGIVEVASRVVTAWVTMRRLSEGEVREYVATGEPLDKAGAYGLQGLGGALVSRVEGSRLAVIGLPLVELAPLLAAAGLSYPAPLPADL